MRRKWNKLLKSWDKVPPKVSGIVTCVTGDTSIYCEAEGATAHAHAPPAKTVMAPQSAYRRLDVERFHYTLVKTTP